VFERKTDQSDFSWGLFLLGIASFRGVLTGIVASLFGGVIGGTLTGGSQAGLIAGMVIFGVGVWLVMLINFATTPAAPVTRCGACKYQVPDDATRCPSCGVRFTSSTAK
jgi:hypothetical protein